VPYIFSCGVPVNFAIANTVSVVLTCKKQQRLFHQRVGATDLISVVVVVFRLYAVDRVCRKRVRLFV